MQKKALELSEWMISTEKPMSAKAGGGWLNFTCYLKHAAIVIYVIFNVTPCSLNYTFSVTVVCTDEQH